jgi:5-methylcytosine-specific restriction endonuclease McrA
MKRTPEQKAAWAAYMRRWVKTPAGKAYVERSSGSPARKAAMRKYDASEKGAAKRARADKEKRRARVHRYHATDKGRIAQATGCSARRARLAGAIGYHSTAAWRELLASYHGFCIYCLAPATTRDHVVPLSRGGRNDIENLVPACASCNSSKHNTPLLVWLARRTELVTPT